MTKSNRGFFSNQGNVHIIVRLMIRFGQFLHHPRLYTKSNRGFFSNQGDATLRVMIQSGQFSNSSEILSMPTLSASFRKIRSNLNGYCWWQSHRFFQLLWGRNSEINYPIWPVFKLVRDFIHVYFIWKSRSKLNELRWWQNQTVAF